ncbi:MAG: type VI secretion system tube protein Hcp [Pseudoxanthomonas sp.]
MAIADYHLKIDGIDGESQDKGHEKQIDLLSFDWGILNRGSTGQGGGGGVGKSVAKDFGFTKRIDGASPKLMQAAARGDVLKKVVLSAAKATGQGGQADYLTITFENCFISGYTAQSSENGVVNDSFTLNVGKVTYEYKPQKADGTLSGVIPANYDWTSNTA